MNPRSFPDATVMQSADGAISRAAKSRTVLNLSMTMESFNNATKTGKSHKDCSGDETKRRLHWQCWQSGRNKFGSWRSVDEELI